jgi:hypothetical protein
MNVPELFKKLIKEYNSIEIVMSKMFIKNKDGELIHMFDVRGYGFIQNYIQSHLGEVRNFEQVENYADEFQDYMAKFVTDAINEKLQKDEGS